MPAGFFTGVSGGYGKKYVSATCCSYHVRREVFIFGYYNQCLPMLTLIALSGECSVDVLSYMGISTSYGEKLITRLKEENLIKTHYRDRLRGYRLTNKAKQLRYRKILTGSLSI